MTKQQKEFNVVSEILDSAKTDAKTAKTAKKPKTDPKPIPEPSFPAITGADDPFYLLADLIAATGYFDGLTRPQMIFQMLAGRELGLSPIRSMFDLEFDQSSGRFQWTQKPFEKLDDETPRFVRFWDYAAPGKDRTVKGMIENGIIRILDDEKLDPDGSFIREKLSEAFTPDDQIKQAGSIATCFNFVCGRQFTQSAPDQIYCSDQCEQKANETKGETEKSNLKEYLMQRDEKRDDLDLIPSNLIPETPEKVKIESPEIPSNGVTNDPAFFQDETPGEMTSIGDEIGKILSDPIAKTITNEYDDLIPENVKAWRFQIETACLDLELNVKEKTEKFDKISADDLPGKKALRDTVQKYHKEQIEKSRSVILEKFAKKGMQPGTAKRTNLLKELHISNDENSWFLQDCRRIKETMEKRRLW